MACDEQRPPLDVSKLAMRIDHFLRLAIRHHRRTYQGRSPICIELHPELERDLRIALGVDYRHHCNPATGELMLEGVTIRYTVFATTPQLINCRNAVETL